MYIVKQKKTTAALQPYACLYIFTFLPFIHRRGDEGIQTSSQLINSVSLGTHGKRRHEKGGLVYPSTFSVDASLTIKRT